MMRTHENQMKPERKQLDHRSEIGKALPSASRLARNTTVLRGPSLDDLAANMQLNPLNLLNPLNCICIFHKWDCKILVYLDHLSPASQISWAWLLVEASLCFCWFCEKDWSQQPAQVKMQWCLLRGNLWYMGGTWSPGGFPEVSWQ